MSRCNAKSQLPWIRSLVAASAIVGLFGWAGSAPAQEKKYEKVKFTTVDGVDIHGRFYSSTKKNAAVCMVLHNVGETSTMKGWTSLAEELQAKGYSVLTFDFRGHGQSTEIFDGQKFWSTPFNATKIKGGPKRASLDQKDFPSHYLPALVNDIAAAKAFLDRKNDGGGCNTGSTILIGAEQGATLGGIWLNSEWYRFKMVPNPVNGLLVPDTKPEGKDVIAAIWLSPSSKLGTANVTQSNLLKVPGWNGATPMMFLHGDKDESGKKIAKDCEKKLVDAKEKDTKYKYTGAVEIKGAKLTGVGLLQKGLTTEESIVTWLDEVVVAKGNEWTDREWRKTQYWWRLPANPNKLMPAKVNQPEMNLQFDSYEKFFPR